jgi:hypothetical protein
MIGIYLSLCLPLYQEQVDKPSLKYFQENFIVRDGTKRLEVPLQLPRERPRLVMSFRKNKNYAVWDERGLTIRIGKVAKSTRLVDIPTSPKAFEREEILENVALFSKKQRQPTATALSGAKRVGNLVFFLVRWEERDGKPWLEALVSVDLTADTFHPTFHARLPGLTLAREKIDDRLFVMSDRLSAISRDGDSWGVAAYDPDTAKFDFNLAGQGLQSYQPISATTGAFVERTERGNMVGGWIDLKTMNRRLLVEERGNVRFIDKNAPLLAVFTDNGDTRLLNTETGAELTLPSSASLRRTQLGLVVWTPLNAPKRAWLYDMARWDIRARWVAEQ